MMMRGQLASRVLAAVVVVTCLTASGDSYVLPDDLMPPTFRPRPTTHHHHHRQQQQQQHDGGAGGAVRVTVKPEHTVMHHSKPVHINCTATASHEQPFISFFVSPPVHCFIQTDLLQRNFLAFDRPVNHKLRIN